MRPKSSVIKLILGLCFLSVTFFSSAHASISVTLKRNIPLIKAGISPFKEHMFLFDTGSRLTYLGEKIALMYDLPKLKKYQFMSKSNKPVAYFKTNPIKLHLKGKQMIFQYPMIMNIDFIKSKINKPLAGIIGCEVFARYIVELNYRDKSFEFWPRKEHKYEGPGTTHPMPLQLAVTNGAPSIKATLHLNEKDSFECVFLIDSGKSSAFDLSLGLFIANNVDKKIKIAGSTKRYAEDGVIEKSVIKIPEIKIGPYSFKDVYGGLDQNKNDNKPYAGYIGSEILKRFTVTFDPESKNIYLEPNKDLNDSFPNPIRK